MTSKPPKNPVALEAAILALRRANNSAVEALLEALTAEEEYLLSLMLTETTNMVFVRQGAFATMRGLRERIKNAETTMHDYEKRVQQGRTAKHGDINP